MNFRFKTFYIKFALILYTSFHLFYSVMKKSFNHALSEALIHYWNLPALTNYSEPGNYTFADVAKEIALLHVFFNSIGLKEGDKIALCAKNSAQWAIAFFATVTYGAVAVPLLHEFTSKDLENLISHSDSLLLFSEKNLWNKIDKTKVAKLKGTIILDSGFELDWYSDENILKCWEERIKVFDEKYPKGLTKKDVVFPKDKPEELVLINYTSGSTGNPKGVMLPRRALMSNLQFALDHMPYMNAGDGLLSILPMAHMYGLLVEVIFPFAKGVHIRFLGRVPSPQVLLRAFAEVKPKLIICVPLVIEKIILTKVLPELQKPLPKLLMKTPVLRRIVGNKVKSQLLKVFGGELYELIIGGSGINPVVEKFLQKIKFPFTVGYGMTETAPLIAYSPWHDREIGSCGRLVHRMKGRIDSPDPKNVPGELSVKGDNVMLGYYKNPEATQQVLDKDGWMRTGDMVQQDDRGLLYIRGRNKTMILGASGQNIYPEEIEAKLNRMPLVEESLIVDRKGKLIALVYPAEEIIRKDKIETAKVTETMNENLRSLNASLPGYSQISQIELQTVPFDKTPKHSIKRYLYS